jgi:hypothetical protein
MEAAILLRGHHRQMIDHDLGKLSLAEDARGIQNFDSYQLPPFQN